MGGFTMKRRVIFLWVALIVAGLLLPALPLAAQPPGQRYEYVTLWKVKPGKSGEFVELLKKVQQPVLDRLVTEGVVLAGGIDEAFVHIPGGETHVTWWQVGSQSGIQRVLEELAAEFGKLTPDETQKFAGTIESHHDLFLRHLIASVKPSTGARPFHWIATVKVQPGKGGEYEELWRKYRQPGYEKAMAEGHLLAYSLAVEEVHTEDPGYRYLWLAFSDLASREKVQAVLHAMRTEEERRRIEALFQGATDPSAHRDLLYRALVYIAK